MGTITRRVAVAVALVAAVAAGCSSNEPTVDASSTTVAPPSEPATTAPSGTTPSDDEVCALLEEFNAAGDSDDLDRALEFIDELKAASPEDLEGSWDILAGSIEALAGLDENDPNSFEAAFDIVLDPEFIGATSEIDEFATDECDIDLGLGDLSEGADDSGSTSTTMGDDEEDPTSIDAVQAHLQDTYGSEAWAPVIDDAPSWGSSSSGGTVSWVVTLSDAAETTSLPISELVAACDAMAEYLDTYEDADIEFLAADETVVVTRTAGQPCAPA